MSAEKAMKAAHFALCSAREMLGVFEDNGGHDGLGGKGYAATLDVIDEASAQLVYEIALAARDAKEGEK